MSRDSCCLHISQVVTMKTPVIYYALLAAFCILTIVHGISLNHLV
jgi:hypothetical protein